MGGGAWWTAVHVIVKSQTQLSDFTFTFHFHALEKEMATHSSVLAWRIPGSGKPGGLPSMGSRSVGHDWSFLAAAAAAGLSSVLFYALGMVWGEEYKGEQLWPDFFCHVSGLLLERQNNNFKWHWIPWIKGTSMWLVTMLIVTQSTRNFAIIAKEKGNFYFLPE